METSVLEPQTSVAGGNNLDGEWCAICNERMAVMISLDGIPACYRCAEGFISGMRGNREQRRRADRDKRAFRRSQAQQRGKRDH